MRPKILSPFIKQFVWGLRILAFCIIYATNANGQPNLSGYSDAARQRLLIHITAHYLHTMAQGQIDLDSAMRIPCKVYGLSPLLAYNEGYSDGKLTVGNKLLDAGKVKEAEALLASLHDEARLRLLLDLGNYFVFKPGTVKADLDEASIFTNEALQLSKTKSTQWQIESMMLQANLLDQSGHKDESQKIFSKIITLGERSGNPQAAARALLSIGGLLPFGDPRRLISFQKALSIFESQDAKEKVIETLSAINVEYFISKRYDLSEQVMQRIVKLQTEINFRQQQYVYDALAWLSFQKADLSSAVFYSDKSFESLRSGADSVFISCFIDRRAFLYQYLRKFENAIAWYNKALKNRKVETMLYWYPAFLSKVTMLQTLRRDKEALSLLQETEKQFPATTYFEKMHFAFRLGRTYADLKKYDLAESNYKVFLAMAVKFPVQYINNEFPNAIFEISNFYLLIGKTSKARQLLEWGKAYTSKFDIARLRLYYYNLYKIDSAEKKYLVAIKDLQLDHNYLDSEYSNDQRKKVEELLVKYEAEKKDKNIKLLNSKNQLDSIRLKEDENTKKITLAGIALLLIICALLFNSYRIKQKSNRKLEANQKELETNQRELETNQRELDQKNVFLETLNSEQNKLLKEKEWLIKEVHHRVKNNLQMVTSLLYSQTFYLEDDKAVLAVKDSLRRIQAMSLIHQQLYQDENTSTIAMTGYFNDLAGYLNESFDAGNRIIFKQTIESLELDVTQAIPLGLIVTESIVNAIKYAFLNEQKGVVCIDLQYDGADHLLLKVSDNGIGLPPGLDTTERSSLGLDLMQGLAKQLNGTFKIENNNGVHITVRFAILNK